MILVIAAGWTERQDMNLPLFEGSMGSKEVETQHIHTKCSRAWFCTIGRYPSSGEKNGNTDVGRILG